MAILFRLIPLLGPLKKERTASARKLLDRPWIDRDCSEIKEMNLEEMSASGN